MHGSPYHVYPTNNYPAVQAFQGPSTTSTASYNVATASPMLAPKFQQQQMVSFHLTPEPFAVLTLLCVFFGSVLCVFAKPSYLCSIFIPNIRARDI